MSSDKVSAAIYSTSLSLIIYAYIRDSLYSVAYLFAYCLLVVCLFRGYQERMRNVLDQMKKPTFTEFNKCLLVGNYVTGVSIHDCIHNTKEILKHNYIV